MRRPLALRLNKYLCKRCGHTWEKEERCNCGARCPKCNIKNKPNKDLMNELRKV